MPVKIVTDSVADLPPQLVRELGITVIPLNVRFGEEVYRDGIDLTTEQFYDKLLNNRILPVTSVPSPGSFAEAYDKLAKETDEILVVTISSKLSGTYEVAVQSAGLMKRKCRVEVLDSKGGAMAEGFIAMKAARTANEGATLDKVIDVAQKTIPRVEIRAAFDTLEYLRRGGRIGKAQALMGSMLNINPIITLKDGVVEPAGRTRSRAKAIERLYNFATTYSSIEAMAVEDGPNPQDGDFLVEKLNSKFSKTPIYRSKITPVISTHTGPGLLLIAIMGDK